MSGQAGRKRSSLGSIVLGVIRLARGRADGMLLFGSTREAFLASLAPLLAFPVVFAVPVLLRGGGLSAVTELLAAVCGLLAPPVLSFEVARLWGRQAAWLRFATAFNWCQWVVPVVGSVLLMVLGVRVAFGLLAFYGLWLHWFVARHGLGLSRARAALMILGVSSITVLIVLGPRMLALASGSAELAGK